MKASAPTKEVCTLACCSPGKCDERWRCVDEWPECDGGEILNTNPCQSDHAVASGGFFAQGTAAGPSARPCCSERNASFRRGHRGEECLSSMSRHASSHQPGEHPRSMRPPAPVVPTIAMPGGGFSGERYAFGRYDIADACTYLAQASVVIGLVLHANGAHALF